MEESSLKREKITSKLRLSMNREFSSGGVVFKKTYTGKVLWLVTKSTPSELIPNDIWRLPKGRLDDISEDEPGPLARGERKASEEEIQKAALKEVKEEGGVEAKIVRKIGTERYFFIWQGEKILKFVTFYLMEYIRDLPEGYDKETEEVAWLPYEDARKRLSYSGEKKVLDKAKEILDSGVQENLL